MGHSLKRKSTKREPAQAD